MVSVEEHSWDQDLLLVPLNCCHDSHICLRELTSQDESLVIDLSEVIRLYEVKRAKNVASVGLVVIKLNVSHVEERLSCVIPY